MAVLMAAVSLVVPLRWPEVQDVDDRAAVGYVDGYGSGGVSPEVSMARAVRV